MDPYTPPSMPLQELSLMTAAKTGIDGVINPQPVAAPLTTRSPLTVIRAVEEEKYFAQRSIASLS
jgi:hypothetical protein